MFSDSLLYMTLKINSSFLFSSPSLVVVFSAVYSQIHFLKKYLVDLTMVNNIQTWKGKGGRGEREKE